MEENENPWLDVRISEEAMKHLRSLFDTKQLTEPNIQTYTLGTVSKSDYLQDTDNWFYENVLKDLANHLYYREFSNYYKVHLEKSMPPAEFYLQKMWINYQKQYEFNPPHQHGSTYSFATFIKIPTHWKEQHALPWLKRANDQQASDFQFLLGEEMGPIRLVNIPLSPEDEGRMLFFPGWLMHQVFPFYGTEEERITISGNLQLIGPESETIAPQNDLDGVNSQIKKLQKGIQTLKDQKKVLKGKL